MTGAAQLGRQGVIGGGAKGTARVQGTPEMTDETKKDDVTPATEAQPQYPRAAKGQDDDGQVVTGAGGEPFFGAIADITDNEPGRKKKK